MDTRLVVSKEDRKCWTLLDRIDEETLNLVKLFKPDGHRLYAALNDGRFIAVGKNWKGLLGLGHDREVETFEEIKALKGMSIKDIVCGFRHTMVLTEDGQLWEWGLDEDEEKVTPPRRILEKDVVDVKCGDDYMLALKKDGKVMTWGWNEYGQLGIVDAFIERTPVSLESLEGVIIDQIEAGSSTGPSIAVSKDGKAYGWGKNWRYQLGPGQLDNVIPPVHIDVHNHNIKSVACNREQTLFLTRAGLMFVTNVKDKGRLTLLETKAPVEHIACVDDLLFLAWTATELYYWGITKEGVEKTKPISTDLSLSQIVSQYSERQHFPTVLYLQQEEEETKVKDITPKSIMKFPQNVSDLFDSAVFSDIEFVFPDHRTIKAHRVILFASSAHLATELCSTWQFLDRVSLSSPSYVIFRHYLSYFYTHTVSFDDFDQLVSLVRLAHDYHEVDLQQVCVQHLCDQLDIDNCSQLYELAVDLKLEQLETRASQMILQKIAQVRLTDGFKNMDREKAFTLFDKM